MPGKRPHSLKKRIDALVHALGGAEKPTFPQIRSQLVEFGALAEALEDAQSTAEKEMAIAALEDENGKLKTELQAANAEIKSLRVERQREEEKTRKIDPIQFQILELLPSPSGTNWRRTDEIARTLKLPLDEADAYINGLEKLGLIIFHSHEPGGGGWRRTKQGNTLAVAKRWAGETEEKKQYKYADRELIQQETLVQLAEGELTEHEIARLLDKRLRLVRHHLHSLRDAKMATDAEEYPRLRSHGDIRAGRHALQPDVEDSAGWRRIPR